MFWWTAIDHMHIHINSTAQAYTEGYTTATNGTSPWHFCKVSIITENATVIYSPFLVIKHRKTRCLASSMLVLVLHASSNWLQIKQLYAFCVVLWCVVVSFMCQSARTLSPWIRCHTFTFMDLRCCMLSKQQSSVATVCRMIFGVVWFCYPCGVDVIHFVDCSVRHLLFISKSKQK